MPNQSITIGKIYQGVARGLSKTARAVGIKKWPRLPKDAIRIRDAIYCKTPEALKAVVAELESCGYEISQEEGSSYRYASRETRKKFDKFGRLNIDSFALKERFSPLEPSKHLFDEIFSAAGMVSNISYYAGSNIEFKPIFNNRSVLSAMRTFVEHFTTLDLNAWDIMIASAPRTPAGMIRAVARFCHPQSKVRRPGSPLHTLLLGHAMATNPDKPVSQDLVDCAEDGLEKIVDPNPYR
jgi:hypothetical protein